MVLSGTGLSVEVRHGVMSKENRVLTVILEYPPGDYEAEVTVFL